jgi:hypothetical protein
VQRFTARVFAEEEAGVDHDDPAHVKKQPAEHSPLPTFRAIHGAANQNQGADGDGDRSGYQQYVRWTEDGDIETVSVMPPVVERGGYDPGESTPGSNESAEWSPKGRNSYA